MPKSFYLDCTSEKASSFVLSELGVLVSENNSNVDSSFQIVQIENKLDLSKEHISGAEVVLKLLNGEVYINIRDSADSWIQIQLIAGEFIVLPPNIFRKFVSVDSESSFQLYSKDGSYQLLKRFLQDVDSIDSIKYHNYRELVCELCQQFFVSGWVTGTGGSISIKYGNRIYMTPSGVQKERIKPDELFVLDTAGNILHVPPRKLDFLTPKLSDCSPLFLHAYKQRNAGAVLHSHAYSANLITSIFEGKSEFKISHQEMIKGISGYGYFDELIVPIIENTAWEHELADKLGETIAKYPKAVAVLVRRHGMYVWGGTWEQAKRHGECLHYLFEVVIKMRQLGLDYTRPPIEADEDVVNKKQKIEEDSNISSAAFKHVVFDIEGTTTPITFVKDVLFRFAFNNVKKFLEDTWDSRQTQEDVQLLIKQLIDDNNNGITKFKSIDSSSSKEEKIKSVVEFVQWNISADRKITALKQLQGHIWDVGYKLGSLKSQVYDDVPSAFRRLTSQGTKVSIYSSGSREAQCLLFKHSNHGDLRPFISTYFDTAIGNKREEKSYKEILQYLGVDTPSEILFVTDIYEEAVAAAQVGIKVVISVREGNASLPIENEFPTISNFNSI